MSIARALAILGAGASGLGAGEEQARQRLRQQEDDAFRKEQRDRTRTQWQRDDEAYNEAKADKEAERQAMAPTVVQPDLAPDQMGPAGFNAGGKTFANPEQADAAAKQYNSPAAGMARAAGAVRNPVRAAQLQGQAVQSELIGIQLDQAKAAQANKAWEDKVLSPFIGSDDPNVLAQRLTASGADGLDGSSKWMSKPVQGNMATVYPVGPDGKPLNQGFTYENTPKGRLEFATFLSKSTPLTAKLADLRTQAKDAAAAADKTADNKRLDRQLDETVRHNQAVEGIQRAAAGAKADKPGLFERMDEADKIQYQSMAKRLESMDNAITKAQADGMWNEDSPNAKQLRQQQAALSLQMRSVLERYQDKNGGGSPDPLGLRKPSQAGGKTAGNESPAARTGQGTVPDAESGKFIIVNEMGGDLAKAEAFAKDLEARAAAAPNVEAKSIMLDEANRIRAGIRAMSQQPRPAGMAGAAARPAPPVVGESQSPAMKPVGNFRPDPVMEKALARELLEMGEGKRMRFSTPELAAYNRAKSEAEKASQAPSTEQLTELQRAQRLSKQQLGKA